LKKSTLILKVKHYRAGSDTLLEKILVETKAGKYNFDVVNLRSFAAYVLMEGGLSGPICQRKLEERLS